MCNVFYHISSWITFWVKYVYMSESLSVHNTLSNNFHHYFQLKLLVLCINNLFMIVTGQIFYFHCHSSFFGHFMWFTCMYMYFIVIFQIFITIPLVSWPYPIIIIVFNYCYSLQ